jgi:hypothetical protein
MLIRLLAALWHVAGFLLLLLLVVEFGVEGLHRGLRRLRLGRATRPHRSATADAYGGAEWPIAYFDEFTRSVRLDFAPHVGWWQRPFAGRYVTIDERGLRVTPGERDAGQAAMRILCLGGSTMMGMGARDSHTIPAELQQRLRALGHDVRVTNAGQLAFNSTQEAIALHQMLKQGVRPDIVVCYDGINEMVCAEQTGAADRYFHETPRRAEFNLLFPDRRGELAQAALIQWLPRTMRRLRKWTGLALRGPLPGGPVDLHRIALDELAEQVVEAYAANLRLVSLLAQSYGFHPLFFWQPVITTKQSKTSDELYFEAEHAVDLTLRRRFFDLVITAYRRHPELSDAADTIDLSRLFDEVTEPLYIDLYHLSEPGNAAVAAAMLPAVVAALGALRQPSAA